MSWPAFSSSVICASQRLDEVAFGLRSCGVGRGERRRSRAVLRRARGEDEGGHAERAKARAREGGSALIRTTRESCIAAQYRPRAGSRSGAGLACGARPCAPNKVSLPYDRPQLPRGVSRSRSASRSASCSRGAASPRSRNRALRRSPRSARRKPRIGLSLDTLKEARWQGDRDAFVKRAEELGAEVLVQSANSDDAKQVADVKALITSERRRAGDGAARRQGHGRGGAARARVGDPGDRVRPHHPRRRPRPLRVHSTTCASGELQAAYLVHARRAHARPSRCASCASTARAPTTTPAAQAGAGRRCSRR